VRFGNDGDDYNRGVNVATPLRGSAMKSKVLGSRSCGGHGGDHKPRGNAMHVKKVTKKEVVVVGLDIGDARHRQLLSLQKMALRSV
jgi:hypothetical protein